MARKRMSERGKDIPRRGTNTGLREITGQGNENSSTVAEILDGNREMANSEAFHAQMENLEV